MTETALLDGAAALQEARRALEIAEARWDETGSDADAYAVLAARERLRAIIREARGEVMGDADHGADLQRHGAGVQAPSAAPAGAAVGPQA